MYVYIPKHGSWLNRGETLFRKMARTFLKNIRVKLKERILLGIKEINEKSVIRTWKNFSFLKSLINITLFYDSLD